MKLPSHNRLVQCFPDAMHTVKDAIERVFFLLIGKTNLDKVLASEVAYGRFGLKLPSRKRKRGGGLSDTKIDQPYVLSSNERRLADERSKMIIMTSKDFDPGSIFFRTTGLKSHDWKEVCTFMHALITIVDCMRS